jgi:DNA-binding transcriptional regulator YiaG
VVLRPAGKLSSVRTIDAIHELVRCGVDAGVAGKAIEAMIVSGQALASVPRIGRAFAANMRAAGVHASRLRELDQANVREIRQRLQMSAQEFARRYRFSPRTVEGWEQGREIPHSANVVLHLIASNPAAVEELLEIPLD